MNGKELNDDTLLAAVEAYADAGLTWRAMAPKLEMTIGQLSGRIYRAKDAQKPKPAPELFRGRLPSPLTLNGNWIVVGDIHVPFTDYDFISNILLVARKRGIKSLLLAGDMFNMDAFSRYEDVVASPTWKEELKAFRQLMLEWLEWFDQIVIIMGNHDRRLQKWTRGEFDDADLMDMVMGSEGLGMHRSKVTSSVFGYCVIETPSGQWRVTHPRNYSINQLNVADTLAQKHDQHIISHHEHHVAQGWDRYKRHVIINNGCMCDPSKLAYVMLDDSKGAGMALSFVALVDGVPTVYGEFPFTDWGGSVDCMP